MQLGVIERLDRDVMGHGMALRHLHSQKWQIFMSGDPGGQAVGCHGSQLESLFTLPSNQSEQSLSSQPSQKLFQTHHPDEAPKPRLPDPIDQPIAVMPPSRM
ncbi:hypothetical protein TNCV_2598551 [Trichonephila clavipes]|nr:hypothetical protein TNCV_2598551 [Trichonephila clavipes]